MLVLCPLRVRPWPMERALGGICPVTPYLAGSPSVQDDAPNCHSQPSTLLVMWSSVPWSLGSERKRFTLSSFQTGTSVRATSKRRAYALRLVIRFDAPSAGGAPFGLSVACHCVFGRQLPACQAFSCPQVLARYRIVDPDCRQFHWDRMMGLTGGSDWSLLFRPTRGQRSNPQNPTKNTLAKPLRPKRKRPVLFGSGRLDYSYQVAGPVSSAQLDCCAPLPLYASVGGGSTNVGQSAPLVSAQSCRISPGLVTPGMVRQDRAEETVCGSHPEWNTLQHAAPLSAALHQ
ncbi:hypothetical protein SCAR479_12918 [Seiridium cardinale]|uniref:Uncharacterized protein n=1 Tax=Seiridium cardinale TaxID=138064 RepID=A0ABR2X9H2_9PEZI